MGDTFEKAFGETSHRSKHCYLQLPRKMPNSLTNDARGLTKAVACPPTRCLVSRIGVGRATDNYSLKVMPPVAELLLAEGWIRIANGGLYIGFETDVSDQRVPRIIRKAKDSLGKLWSLAFRA